MTVSVLPMLTEPVIEQLLADPEFAALIPGGIGTRAPADVTDPYAVIRISVSALSGSRRAYGGTVQVNGCAARSSATAAPETVAWTIAATAADIFARDRVHTWRNLSYRLEIEDIYPGDRPDVTRGEASPVWWCQVRADLRLNLH